MSVGTGSHVAESGERRFLQTLRDGNRPGQNVTVFDVGANRGDYTLAALAALGPAARIHCFEPSRHAFRELEERLGAERAVVLSNVGLSDAPGRSPMFADRPGSPLGSLYKRHLEHVQIPVEKTEDVELTTADEYAASRGIGFIQLLKVDAEGHELAVLRGAERLLAEERVGYVQFEFGGTNIDSRTYLRDFYERLEPRYELHRIVADGLHPLGGYREANEIFMTTNFLAKPTGPARVQA